MRWLKHSLLNCANDVNSLHFQSYYLNIVLWIGVISIEMRNRFHFILVDIIIVIITFMHGEREPAIQMIQFFCHYQLCMSFTKYTTHI